MAGHRRMDTRYAIEFPVQLVHGKRAHSLVTHDVSQGGIFVRTESPPPLLQLVQVQLVLPIGGHALRAHGMTVHVVERDNASGREPGIGVQFYALDQATRDAWEAFTRHVAARYPESPDQTPLRLVRGVTPEPLSRKFVRHTAVLEWKPETRETLEQMYTDDVPRGRVFVPGETDLPIGTIVVIHVTHPDDKASFLMQAKVTRRGASPRGLYVELLGVDRTFREELLEFIRRSIVFDDETVEPSKPSL